MIFGPDGELTAHPRSLAELRGRFAAKKGGRKRKEMEGKERREGLSSNKNPSYGLR